jgi:hypothetical protein
MRVPLWIGRFAQEIRDGDGRVNDPCHRRRPLSRASARPRRSPLQAAQFGASTRWIGIVNGRMSLARTTAEPFAAS